MYSSSKDTDIIEVEDSFEIIVSLPSTIVSSYILTLPNTAKIMNLYNMYYATISLVSSNNNQFRILVDVTNIP